MVTRGIALAAAAIAIAAAAVLPGTAAADPAPLPAVRHVFVVNLENFSFRESFGSASPDAAYIASVLPSRGLKIDNFYGIGHNSLDNYIAQISGQAPNPNSQSDCLQYIDFTPGALDPNGQAAGQGCVFPAAVQTLPDQMQARGLNWKGYMQDLGKIPKRDGGYRCGRPMIGDADAASTQQRDKYATKHNPFVYFHSLIDDDSSCRRHVGPLDELFTDMQSVDTTPNLAFITPNQCDDGHDDVCEQYSLEGDNGSEGGDISAAGRFIAWLAPKILASPAYRQDGLLVITSDEAHIFLVATADAEPDDTAACCNEIPGPNSSSPGISGPGGGKIGAVLASPFIRPGTSSASSYNHYSFLRSLEDVFGITTGGTDGHGHLGFAAATAAGSPGSFGSDVYNLPLGGPLGPGPRDATPGRQPVGPRPAGDGAGWESPGVQGNDLNGVSCPAAGTCVAVGDTGTVVLREDGAGWSVVRSGVADDLLDVSCPSSIDCIAVGQGGLVLRSGDGGRTWRDARISTSTLRGVSCVPDGTCFAVGDGGTIERSSDGGQTWTDVASGITERLDRVDCPTADKCVATGGERHAYDLVTSDGGVTWAVKVVITGGDNGKGVACASEQVCTIASADAVARWTADGGASWGGQSQTSALNNVLGLTCVDDHVCYAVGTRASVFKLTKDGSSGTFVRQTPAPDANFGDDLRDIACPEPAACFAVGDEGQILATTDGATWTSERKGLVPVTPGNRTDPAVATLRAATCSDAGACVAVGDEGSVATKAGPSAPWLPALSGTRGSQWTPTLFGVSCPGAGVCVAVGSYGTLLRSADGGRSWSTQSPAQPGAELYGVDCFSESACVAVGAYGTTLRSTDAGSTWTEIAAVTPYGLNGVGCTAAGTCVAVGAMGRILRSIDGGASWSAVDSGTLGYLASVSCPGDTCVAVGQSGLALVSQDGGLTWNSSATGVDDGLDAVACQSPTQCTATGANGTVLRTGDAGASWSVVGTGTARGLNGVACASTVVCYAVGDGTSVLAIGDQPAASAPSLAIGDATAGEGDSGVSFVPLTVHLSSPVATGDEVDVTYATRPLTGADAATPGDDYLAVSGRLRFLPGDSDAQVLVPVLGDSLHESDERLEVVLSSAAGAFVDRAEAVLTILDDDPATGLSESGQPAAGTEDGATAAPAIGGSAPAPDGSGFLAARARPRCHVPSLVGKRLVRALRLLTRAGCSIGRVVESRSRKRTGTVLAQRPGPGSERASGTRISIRVSSGPRASRRR